MIVTYKEDGLILKFENENEVKTVLRRFKPVIADGNNMAKLQPENANFAEVIKTFIQDFKNLEPTVDGESLTYHLSKNDSIFFIMSMFFGLMSSKSAIELNIERLEAKGRELELIEMMNRENTAFDLFMEEDGIPDDRKKALEGIFEAREDFNKWLKNNFQN